MGSDLERQEAEQQKRRNQEALEAKVDLYSRERFLQDHRLHILRITAKVLNAPVSYSDEEWSIAFQAVNEALDSYNESKGNFWTYAVLVIRYRLSNEAGKNPKRSTAMQVQPGLSDRHMNDGDPGYGMQKQVRDRTGLMQENHLRGEIEALQKELAAFDISFSDLADCSPYSPKTRQSCAKLIKALFTQPPLMPKLRSSFVLPSKDLLQRTGEKKKTVERYRKYLICSGLILDGDYPGLEEYLQFINKEAQTEGGDDE